MRPIKKAATDQSIVIFIMDESDGTPEIAVYDSTAGIDLWYRREGSTLSAIVETTLASIAAAHADGGFLHIANGLYRLDLPDLACATGTNGVVIGGSVTGMIVIGPYIPLYDIDPYDAVRGGMTALPDAAADAAGGLPISDAGGLDLDTIFSTVEAILADTDDIGTAGAGLTAVTSTTDSILADTVELISTADGILTDTDEIGAAGAGLTAITSTTDSILADTLVIGAAGVGLTAITSTTDSILADTVELISTADAILSDTDDIGSLGEGLTALPWNAAWDAEVQSEVGDAIPSIADAVWDEAIADHVTSASFGLWIAKGMAKGQAWSNRTFAMVDSTDNVTPKTGLTITATVSKDAGAFGGIAGSINEVSNGIYQLDATAADMAADSLIFRFVASGASDSWIVAETS